MAYDPSMSAEFKQWWDSVPEFDNTMNLGHILEQKYASNPSFVPEFVHLGSGPDNPGQYLAFYRGHIIQAGGGPAGSHAWMGISGDVGFQGPDGRWYLSPGGQAALMQQAGAATSSGGLGGMLDNFVEGFAANPAISIPLLLSGFGVIPSPVSALSNLFGGAELMGPSAAELGVPGATGYAAPYAAPVAGAAPIYGSQSMAAPISNPGADMLTGLPFGDNPEFFPNTGSPMTEAPLAYPMPVPTPIPPPVVPTPGDPTGFPGLNNPPAVAGVAALASGLANADPYGGDTEAAARDLATAAESSTPVVTGGPVDVSVTGPSTTPPGMWQRIMDRTATPDDWGRVLGTAGSTALGLYGANQQADAMRDVANTNAGLAREFMGLGAPYRARLDASYAPGFDLWSQPAYSTALDRAADVSGRAWSARAGNPAGSPTAQGGIYRDVLAGLVLPEQSNYRGQLGQFGGLGLNTAGSLYSGNTAPLMAAAGAQGQGLNAIGYGVNNLTNPQNSLDDLIRKLSFGGNYGRNVGGLA